MPADSQESAQNMKTFDDDNENQTLRIYDYTTGAVSGSNIFSDTDEREHIREHAKNRLESFLNPQPATKEN